MTWRRRPTSSPGSSGSRPRPLRPPVRPPGGTTRTPRSAWPAGTRPADQAIWSSGAALDGPEVVEERMRGGLGAQVLHLAGSVAPAFPDVRPEVGLRDA